MVALLVEEFGALCIAIRGGARREQVFSNRIYNFLQMHGPRRADTEGITVFEAGRLRDRLTAEIAASIHFFIRVSLFWIERAMLHSG